MFKTKREDANQYIDMLIQSKAFTIETRQEGVDGFLIILDLKKSSLQYLCSFSIEGKFESWWFDKYTKEYNTTSEVFDSLPFSVKRILIYYFDILD